MFRGVSALESEHAESTETADFDPVTDEIPRWSSLSEHDEIPRWSSLPEHQYERFLSVEDGVLKEFEMLWQLRQVL